MKEKGVDQKRWIIWLQWDRKAAALARILIFAMTTLAIENFISRYQPKDNGKGYLKIPSKSDQRVRKAKLRDLDPFRFQFQHRLMTTVPSRDPPKGHCKEKTMFRKTIKE